jgi:hypothetical protein
MTTTKQYDFLNRLTAIRTLNAQQSAINSDDYQLNAANQRIRSTLADGSYWLYAKGRNRDGFTHQVPVIAAHRCWPNEWRGLV